MEQAKMTTTMDKEFMSIAKKARIEATSGVPTFSTTEEREYSTLCKAFPLSVIKSDAHNSAALKVAAALIRRETTLTNGGLTYLRALSQFISQYESIRYEHVIGSSRSGPEILKYLLEENSLSQADLAREVGTERQNISNYLACRRALSKEIRLRLCKRFSLAVDVFEFSPTKACK